MSQILVPNQKRLILLAGRSYPALAQEVAELQGVRHNCRGAVQRAILRLRDVLQQFVKGEQGIRSLCGSLKAVLRKGLDDDEEEGYYDDDDR